MTAAPENAEPPPHEAGQPAVAENSNAIALGLLGDEWNLAIVKLAIMSGVRRYKDFRDMLGIANSVLTVRLRRLTEAGVFTMRPADKSVNASTGTPNSLGLPPARSPGPGTITAVTASPPRPAARARRTRGPPAGWPAPPRPRPGTHSCPR